MISALTFAPSARDGLKYSWCVSLQSTFSVEGDKLVQVQKWNGKETKFVREIKDGKMVMVRCSKINMLRLCEIGKNGAHLHAPFKPNYFTLFTVYSNLYFQMKTICFAVHVQHLTIFPSLPTVFDFWRSHGGPHIWEGLTSASHSSKSCNNVFIFVLQYAVDCTEITLPFCQTLLNERPKVWPYVNKNVTKK